MISDTRPVRPWVWCVGVFGFVAGFQLWLVAAAGTDIPFYDQWGIEGSWLYPRSQHGSLQAVELLQPFNEHRIVWTHLLNLALFKANGQWDPLVQLIANVGLRAGCAALLVWLVMISRRVVASRHAATAVAGAVALAFLPQLAWHNVLWGIETHAYFSLGFSLLAIGLLAGRERKSGATLAGLLAGVAGLLAMGPSALVPVALLGLAALHGVEFRRVGAAFWREAWPAFVLLALALGLRATVQEHAVLQPASAVDFLVAAGRLLGWPHVGQPLAALAMNAPLAYLLVRRMGRKRMPVEGENFVLGVAAWSAAVGLATAWVRGGSEELRAGVPSRYVDFVVLLPLANLWCAVQLAREVSGSPQTKARWLAATWGTFLAIGWVGLSAEMMRQVILPRAADRAAPVRLIRAYQESGDPAVFSGQPRLLVPHPNMEAVRSVISDPRMRGALPPSMQPELPMGPLSKAARWVVGDPRD